MKQRGIPIWIILLDPAGENKEPDNHSGSVYWKPLQSIDFEFTSHETPQHNNLAELSFPYSSGRARAMMETAHVPDDFWGELAWWIGNWGDRISSITRWSSVTQDVLAFKTIQSGSSAWGPEQYWSHYRWSRSWWQCLKLCNQDDVHRVSSWKVDRQHLDEGPGHKCICNDMWYHLDEANELWAPKWQIFWSQTRPK